MRIQREIIPSINEEKNRQLYDQKLKENSTAHILNFKGEGLRVDKNSLGYFNDRIKNQYINEELRKRQGSSGGVCLIAVKMITIGDAFKSPEHC